MKKVRLIAEILLIIAVILLYVGTIMNVSSNGRMWTEIRSQELRIEGLELELEQLKGE